MRRERSLRRGAVWMVAMLAAPPSFAAEPCADWELVDTPNPGTTFNFINGVARLGAGDALAMGRDGQGAFALRWNRTTWSEIAIPSTAEVGGTYIVEGCGSTPAGDVWAVGAVFLSSFDSAPLAMRHDGTDWDLVEVVSLDGARTGGAVAVHALADDDAWAVGAKGGDGGGVGGSPVLAMHWDGSSWTEFPAPAVGDRQNHLESVSMVATDDVWAVGDHQNIVQSPLGFHATTLHWDGSTWSEIVNPGYSIAEGTHLMSVAAVATDDVWAAGYGPDGVLFMHWDGSGWSIVPAPATSSSFGGGLTVLAPHDIWATTGREFLHWNGADWQVVLPAEVPGASGIALGQLARIGACELWAAGSYQPEGAPYARTLAQHFQAGVVSVPGTVTAPSIISGLIARPNPLRARAVIGFDLTENAVVSMNVFDASGRQVLTRAGRRHPAGTHAVELDATGLASGTYFVRVEAGAESMAMPISVHR